MRCEAKELDRASADDVGRYAKLRGQRCHVRGRSEVCEDSGERRRRKTGQQGPEEVDRAADGVELEEERVVRGRGGVLERNGVEVNVFDLWMPGEK